MEKLGLIILAIFAGMSNGFQAPVNAALGKFVGVFESSCISFTVGAFFVTTALFVVPKIGAAVMIASVITGQMTAALIIDHVGLLGIPKNPLDLYRIGGLAFLAIGIKLLAK